MAKEDFLEPAGSKLEYSSANSENVSRDEPRNSISTAMAEDGKPDGDARPKLPRKPSKSEKPAEICFEAREKSRKSLRDGDKGSAVTALEVALEELDSATPSKDSPPVLSEKIKILGDLGELGDPKRFAEGRKLLDRLESSSRSMEFSAESDRCENLDSNTRYQMNLEAAQETLELSVHIHYWEKAVEAAQDVVRLVKDFFEVKNNPMDRFTKCKIYLDAGLGRENFAIENGWGSFQHSELALEHMKSALKYYNEGCYLTNLYHEHFDHPNALFTGLDHDYCSTLFFSAARVCLYFDEHLSPIRPNEFDCNPPLEAEDWRHQALIFLERGRARALLDSLIHAKILSKPWKELKAVVGAVASEANARLKGHKSRDRSRSHSASSRQDQNGDHEDEEMVRALRNRYRWQKAVLATLDEDLSKLMSVSVYNEEVVQMRAGIPEDTAVVELGLVRLPPQRILTLIMTSDKIEAAKLQEIKLSELQEHIDILRLYMGFRSELNKSPRAAIPEDLQKYRHVEDGNDMEMRLHRAKHYLSETLLFPFKNQLRKKKNLIFIPSGDIAHIPWPLLSLDPEEPENLLVSSHTIAVIPSLSIWHHLRQNFESATPGEPPIAVFTNSPRDEFNRLRSDLPFSRIEALHIARTHGTWPILADKMCRKEFRERACRRGIIHLSAHGNFDHKSPLNSTIHLFRDSLTVRDLKDFDLSAMLVVFSACLSGLSRSFESGSAFSFAHTLLGSGARAFLGTLWPVNDAATLLVMMLFYEQLRKGCSPVEALQQAQLNMLHLEEGDLNRLIGTLRNLEDDTGTENYIYNLRYRLLHDEHLPMRKAEDFRAPQYWAGFTLIGMGNAPLYRLDTDRKFRSPHKRSATTEIGAIWQKKTMYEEVSPSLRTETDKVPQIFIGEHELHERPEQNATKKDQHYGRISGSGD